jgi:uncharacterized protein
MRGAVTGHLGSAAPRAGHSSQDVGHAACPVLYGSRLAKERSVMLIKKMSLRECRNLLARVGFGRLACARENQPYIVPIYFAYEPDHLYGFSTIGRKIEWMRLNPFVCLQTDEVLNRHNWASVIVLGRYEELPDTPEYVKERNQAQPCSGSDRCGGSPGMLLPKLAVGASLPPQFFTAFTSRRLRDFAPPLTKWKE